MGQEASILRSPSLHPLALSSHQRHQGGPNEVKTTSTSFSLTYLHLFLSSYSESSEQKKKGRRQPTLHVLLALSDQILPLLCWRPDESTDNSLKFNPMTQSQQYSVVFPSLPNRSRLPGLSLALYGPAGLLEPFSNLKSRPRASVAASHLCFDPASLSKSCVWTSTLSKGARGRREAMLGFFLRQIILVVLGRTRNPQQLCRCTKIYA